MKRLEFLALLLFVTPAHAVEFTGRATTVDADTIDMEGAPARVRLFGIDAPERGQICTDAADKRFLCGSRAADELSAILGRNPVVTCRQTSLDRWRRVVAICRIGELDIGAEMVRRGWALDFVRYSRGRYEAQEEAARNAKAGLWAGDFEIPWEWRLQKRSRSGARP